MKDTHLILLVEDNEGDVTLVREVLEGGPFPVDLQVAADGNEALALLRGEGRYAGSPRPHLILLDLNMPCRDGFSVLKVIKEDPSLRTIPVVVFSSSEVDADVQRSYALGANGFVCKPLDFSRFREKLTVVALFWLGVGELPKRPAPSV